jgi:hypothetical protein
VIFALMRWDMRLLEEGALRNRKGSLCEREWWIQVE